MTILGLPIEMVFVFIATMIAGSLGAMHYVVVHKILGKPFPEIETSTRSEIETEMD